MMTGESIGSKSYKVLPNLSKVLYKHLDCLVSVRGGDEKSTRRVRPLCGNLIQKKVHEIPLHFTDARLHYTHSNALHFHFY